MLAPFAKAVVVDIEGVGQVLFCHGSPRSDEEIVTAATSEYRFQEILAGVKQDLIVCGHTNAQFDRHVGPQRVVNAGSVGMPYQGKPILGYSGSCSVPAASPISEATMTCAEQLRESGPPGPPRPRT